MPPAAGAGEARHRRGAAHAPTVMETVEAPVIGSYNPERSGTATLALGGTSIAVISPSLSPPACSRRLRRGRRRPAPRRRLLTSRGAEAVVEGSVDEVAARAERSWPRWGSPGRGEHRGPGRQAGAQGQEGRPRRQHRHQARVGQDDEGRGDGAGESGRVGQGLREGRVEPDRGEGVSCHAGRP